MFQCLTEVDSLVRSVFDGIVQCLMRQYRDRKALNKDPTAKSRGRTLILLGKLLDLNEDVII